MAIDLNKYKLSSNLDKYKLGTSTATANTSSAPNYNIMAPASANAPIGEKLIRGAGNLVSNIFGEVLEGGAKAVANYAG
jgi:hypothetical protein